MKKINIKIFVLALLCATLLSEISVVSYADDTNYAALAKQYELIASQGGNEQVSAADAKALAQYYGALATQSSSSENVTASTNDVSLVTGKIMALKATYPDGTPWGDNTPYTTRSQYPNMSSSATACQAFAYLVQDAAFGTQKYKRHSTGIGSYVRKKVGAGNGYKLVMGNSRFIPTKSVYSSNDPEWDLVMQSNNDHAWIPVYPNNVRIYDGMDPKINAQFEKMWSQLTVGDMICDANHAAVVLTKNDAGITIVEGNSNSSVKWGRYISKETLRVALYDVYSCKW